jgi:hypothetical protein
MNNCIAGYLCLIEQDESISYYHDLGEVDLEGRAVCYIQKLQFREDTIELEEEWGKFCHELFNSWNTDNNFYRDVNDYIDLEMEFNSKDMIHFIKMINSYWLETCGSPFDFENADEEKIWNCIAYVWINSEHGIPFKTFVCQKIQEQFNTSTCDATFGNKTDNHISSSSF